MRLATAGVEPVWNDRRKLNYYKNLPLELSQTYFFAHTLQRSTPIPLYNKSHRLDVPLALSSMAPDGGIVSTLADSLRFLRTYKVVAAAA